MNEPPVRYDETVDLTLSVMTLRRAGFETRARAAAGAGFAGMGWRWEDFAEAPAEAAEAAQRLLLELQLELTELEFLREWLGREHDAEYQREERQLWELARRFGTRRVNVADFDPEPADQIARRLKGLCQRAGEFGLTVQLEFMPYTPPVDSLAVAWEIVQMADEPNAGLLIDAWHWARTPGSSAAMLEVPADRITGIQLADTPARATANITDESRHHRLVPGEGEFDLRGFLRELAAHGVRAPLAVEVMSDELDEMTPEAAAKRVADGARAVLRKS